MAPGTLETGFHTPAWADSACLCICEVAVSMCGQCRLCRSHQSCWLRTREPLRLLKLRFQLGLSSNATSSHQSGNMPLVSTHDHSPCSEMTVVTTRFQSCRANRPDPRLQSSSGRMLVTPSLPPCWYWRRNVKVALSLNARHRSAPFPQTQETAHFPHSTVWQSNLRFACRRACWRGPCACIGNTDASEV